MTRAEFVFALFSELVRLLFGLAVTLVNAGVLYYVLTKVTGETNKDMVIAIVNGSGVLQGLVMSYYFGSSAGSAAKDRASAKGP